VQSGKECWLTGVWSVITQKPSSYFRARTTASAIKNVCAQFVPCAADGGLLCEGASRNRRQQVSGGELARTTLHEREMTDPLWRRSRIASRYLSHLDITADRQTAAGEDPSEVLAAKDHSLKEKLANSKQM